MGTRRDGVNRMRLGCRLCVEGSHELGHPSARDLRTCLFTDDHDATVGTGRGTAGGSTRGLWKAARRSGALWTHGETINAA